MHVVLQLHFCICLVGGAVHTCLWRVTAVKDWCPSTMRMSRLIQAEVLRVEHMWGVRAMLRMKPSVHQWRCCSRHTRRWEGQPAGGTAEEGGLG